MLLYEGLFKVRALGLALDKPDMSFIQGEVVWRACALCF